MVKPKSLCFTLESSFCSSKIIAPCTLSLTCRNSVYWIKQLKLQWTTPDVSFPSDQSKVAGDRYQTLGMLSSSSVMLWCQAACLWESCKRHTLTNTHAPPCRCARSLKATRVIVGPLTLMRTDTKGHLEMSQQRSGCWATFPTCPFAEQLPVNP